MRPLALSPDGRLLLATNTPDNRLAIFAVSDAGLSLAGEVPVGLEPVAVAARAKPNGHIEAWVVNHLSDSVSIVAIDPAAIGRARVVRTLLVGDEPRDIVIASPRDARRTHAGPPVADRVFITTARRGQNVPIAPDLTRPGVGRALVWVFDADRLGAALGGTPLTILELFADTPRALAVSPDGSTVYAAAFHSGNRTTALPATVVGANGGPPPPPPGATAGAPATALIIRYDPTSGRWEDEMRRDWGRFVRFSLPDADLFRIDAGADPPVVAGHWSGAGTTLFNLAVRPDNGHVYVSNTEARNQVRFEPHIDGQRGLRGHVAENRVTVVSGATVRPVHLNPHIDYDVPEGNAGERARSLALPMGMAFSADGRSLYLAAFGSSRLAILAADALEAGHVVARQVEVGAGPSGVAVDGARGRVFVMTQIDHAIALVAVDGDTPRVTARVSLGHDPTPPSIRAGRRFLYDARTTSGHGDLACASCHVFGDLDGLAWDLGDPFVPALPNPNRFVGGAAGHDFHPLKGPMATQSLRGLALTGPMHWRGDRTAGNDPGGSFLDEAGALRQFNQTFVALLGRHAELADDEMQSLTDFILSLSYPPNPIRRLDNVASAAQAAGERLFRRAPAAAAPACQRCHVPPLGTAGLSARLAHGEELKIPHLRNLYQKIGRFDGGAQVRGFGFLHDGSVSTLVSLFQPPVAHFGKRRGGDHLAAYLSAFDTGLRPIVGQQLTMNAATVADAAARRRLALLRARAEAGDCELIVHGVVDARPRAFLLTGHGRYQSNRAVDAPLGQAALDALARRPGQELTYNCVPPGSGTRMALDRDEDGVWDGAEESGPRAVGSGS